MRMCSIVSGSSGNCIYIGSDTTHILIDAGISGKRTEEGLNKLGLSMADVSAVLVSHEHADHIQGLGVLARKYHKNICCTKGTRDAILQDGKVGKIDEDLFSEVYADEKFTIGDLQITPIKISHDAAQPVAYKISHGTKRCAVVTDLGYYDDYIVESLRGVNVLLLEANHDVNMLQVGPYPYYLKQRILGQRGHLSNESCGQLMCKLAHKDLQAVVLGHLSKENNLPELAYETVRSEMVMTDGACEKLPCPMKDFPLYVAKRYDVSDIIHMG